MLCARSRIVPNHQNLVCAVISVSDSNFKYALAKTKKSVAERREETRIAKRREGTKKRRKQHAARKGDGK
jgi:hypothetical protein